jgi:hypothetical protein
MGYSCYKRVHLEQDLRRLNDAALDLLWRLNPEALASPPAPQWLPEFLPTEVHRAASDLMNKLFLILDEVREIDTPALRSNWSILRGKVPDTEYLLRYVAEDLLDLTAAFTRLSRRLRTGEPRKTGPNAPNRQLRWLAESVIAHAEPVLEAAIVSPDALSDRRRRKARAA